MYILRIDHRGYAYDPTDRTRTPFTLATALRVALGCRNAHVERADGTTVVADAGRAYSDHVHAPTGRTLRTGARRFPAPTPPHVCRAEYPGLTVGGYLHMHCRCGLVAAHVERAEAAR